MKLITYWPGILSCEHKKGQIPEGPEVAEPQLPQQRFLQCLSRLQKNIILI